MKESTEARNVKSEVIRQLKQLGHTVYDCTCEDGTSQTNVLTKIVSACNAHAVDLDVSIHFNSGYGDKNGNGKTTGVEVLIYNEASQAKETAEKVCESISELGFKNRGVKVRSDLYFLRKTNAPAMLIECCFVDDKDDVNLYDSQSMAGAIVYGITGKRADQTDEAETSAQNKSQSEATEQMYRVQVGAYRSKSNAESMQTKLKKAGFDAVIVRV